MPWPRASGWTPANVACVWPSSGPCLVDDGDPLTAPVDGDVAAAGQDLRGVGVSEVGAADDERTRVVLGHGA